jgi:K+-sensing histidine kinase KdpD
MVWIANLIFAGDQIHYVQLRLRTARVEGFAAKLRRGWTFALGQLLMTAALTIACLSGWIPAIASLAFSPLLFRGWFYFIQKAGPLAVRKLGWSELSYAVTFCVVFIAAFAIAK